MRDESKTKEELINELSQLRQRISELESLGREGGGTENWVAFRESNGKKSLDTVAKNSPGVGSLLSDIFIKAQEQERKRIAQELHDVMGHTLTSIKLSVENLLRDGKAIKNKSRLMDVIEKVKNANKEVHQIIYALRPPILDDLGLAATVSWFCRNLEKSCPWIFIEQKIEMPEGEPCDYLNINIFRIIQEATNNVVKHSQSDRVKLYLSKKNSLVELIVEDNGAGFNMQEKLSGLNGEYGVGLFTMKGRTESSGGLFSISTKPGEGTYVKAVWSCSNVPSCCSENCRKGKK